jgi:hypothetical protein
LGARACINGLARLVNSSSEIRVCQRGGRNQIDLSAKQLLKRFLQPKVAVKKAARVVLAELDQKIDVAVSRVKRAIGSRAKHLQILHAEAAAQCGNFGAALFDEVNHGVLSLGLCRQRWIRRLNQRLKHYVFPRTLANVTQAVRLADAAVLYDWLDISPGTHTAVALCKGILTQELMQPLPQ